MNIRSAVAIGTFAFASLLHAADTGIEFAGVLTADGKTRLALTDKAKKATTWIEVGQEFNGYTVARYDAKEDAVFLKKDGRETRLSLVAAKTTDASATATATSPSTEAAAAGIRSNLRLLASAARQFQAQNGVSSAGYTDLVGPGKIIKELRPVAGENYSTLNFSPNVTAVSVTTTSGLTVSIDLPPPSTAVPGTITASPAPLPATTPAPGNTASPAATAPVPSTEALPPVGRQPASPSYTIQGGDSWEKISETTGVPIMQLKQLNPAILDGSALPAGQTIKVR